MNRWLIDTEELISDLEDRDNGNHSIRTSKKKKKILKTENSLKALWDNIKCINIHIIGFTEGKGGS